LPLRGTPTPSDIAHGKTHLEKQLAIIRPKIVVLMGSVAVFGVLQRKIPVLKDHGKTIKENGMTYFLTVHPAAGLRFPALRKIFIEDFRKLKSLLNKSTITGFLK